MKRFKTLFHIEMKKVWKSKSFWVSLLLGMILAAMSALYMIESYLEPLTSGEMEGVWGLQSISLYNSWIGGEISSFGFTGFFYLLPLLAALPYGWSYFQEKQSGYAGMIAMRAGRKNYFLAKFAATFLSGGLVIFIPLVVNLLAVACFVPARLPLIIHRTYYGVEYGSMWAELFYTHPLIFVFMYLVLDFVFAGFFACLCMTVAFFSRNSLAVILLPYLSILFLHHCRLFTQYTNVDEISPLYYLHSTCLTNFVNGWIVLGEGVLLAVLTLGIVLGIGAKREIL